MWGPSPLAGEGAQLIFMTARPEEFAKDGGDAAALGLEAPRAHHGLPPWPALPGQRSCSLQSLSGRGRHQHRAQQPGPCRLYEGLAVRAPSATMHGGAMLLGPPVGSATERTLAGHSGACVVLHSNGRDSFVRKTAANVAASHGLKLRPTSSTPFGCSGCPFLRSARKPSTLRDRQLRYELYSRPHDRRRGGEQRPVRSARHGQGGGAAGVAVFRATRRIHQRGQFSRPRSQEVKSRGSRHRRHAIAGAMQSACGCNGCRDWSGHS